MQAPRFRRIIILLLGVLGVQLWLLVGRSHWGTNLQLKLLLVTAVLTAVPPVSRRVAGWLDALRQPSPRARAIVALLIVPLAATLLYFTATFQDRLRFPATHDERMYVLQARMLAEGRLWMRPHPAADSFETVYVIVRPVYAAMYFPGAAMAYAAGMLLHVPLIAIPLVIAGGVVAMTYRVIAELIDGVAGVLAAMMTVAVSSFRYVSTMFLSHGVMLLLGLALICAWLRWRERPTLRRAAAMGVLAGWAAVTRPLDALCFAVPVAVAILIDLRPLAWRRRLATIAVLFAGAMPFLALQAIFNVGVTGRLLETPVSFYNRQDAPGVAYGFSPPPPGVRPRSSLPQKQALYDDMIVPAIELHSQQGLWELWSTQRLPWMVRHVMPSALMLLLAPVGLAGARPRHLVVIAVLPLFVLAYAAFPWLLAHYCVLAIPAVCCLVLLAGRAVEAAWPRARAAASTAIALGIGAICVTSFPQINRLARDAWWFHPPIIQFDHDRLPKLVSRPALVLYRAHAWNNPYDEPVYNLDVAWPDDAQIIRAHDLAPEQNRRLFEHYAGVQPGRHVYRIGRQDRIDGLEGDVVPEYLGTAADLAARVAHGPPPPPATSAATRPATAPATAPDDPL